MSFDGVPEISTRCYEELTLGERFGPFIERYERAHSDRLRGTIGIAQPGRHAPPGMLPLITLRVLRRALDGIIPGGVLAKQSFAVHAELPAEGELQVGVIVTDVSHPRGRLAVTFTFELRHERKLAAVVTWTILAP